MGFCKIAVFKGFIFCILPEKFLLFLNFRNYIKKEKIVLHAVSQRDFHFQISYPRMF
ncbi:hypothetical protein LEP1GSC188_0028 [Leptospira weilii serovar Topaz str. LT2116]|uniref:Uncharacterized protein n=1 Tax=Leptospira weilii serovar Topaz str. LT2116 TaxID=1088540 RepID=M3GRD4_9LEPT|nr:hypothetical protein LEP1GSC188_0028 [Leptospira weilii serovar Topaz str. LT2116]